MENFIVSARKYRPDAFSTVVGQLAITNTLKNSIKINHLAHAYLFCGPRGVGKTTCARIFAKTINCTNQTADYEACNECVSCKGFNNSGSFNIHELDAASNNSVEDIRNLIDQVRIPPQIGKYSIYIIDEVHMLSSQAFNAFLKTLEEPPAHAIFILATTEKQKIIPTILSRCQVFDFNRIKVNDITSHLEYVAKNEGIAYEQEALDLIAQKSDGGMRDALSIFDQIGSYTENNISFDKVIEILNVLDYDYYFKITDAFVRGDISDALLIYNEISDKGFDSHFFINGLSSHFRDLLVSKDEITVNLLEFGSNIKEQYKNFAKNVDVNFIYKALELTNKCDLDYKASRNKKLHIELTLIKLCNINNIDLLDKKKSESLIVNKPKESSKVETVKEQKLDLVKSPSHNYLKNTSNQTNDSKTVASTISIKNAMHGREENEEKVEELVKLNSDFSEEKAIEVWDKFVKSTQKDKQRIYSILSQEKLQIKEKLNFIITVYSTSQQSAIEGFKLIMLEDLRKELKNDFINIETNFVSQQEENKKSHLYTDEDKYKYMAEKNPEIDYMKNKLGLDFK
jgi:DNA polymerase-3 subunit gamma/tau